MMRGLLLTATGVALGLAGSVAATRLVRQMLFGIETTDLGTYVGVSVALTVVALFACLVPACRAGRVDPAIVLRAE